MAKVHLKV